MVWESYMDGYVFNIRAHKSMKETKRSLFHPFAHILKTEKKWEKTEKGGLLKSFRYVWIWALCDMRSMSSPCTTRQRTATSCKWSTCAMISMIHVRIYMYCSAIKKGIRLKEYIFSLNISFKPNNHCRQTQNHVCAQVFRDNNISACIWLGASYENIAPKLRRCRSRSRLAQR